MARVLVTGGAGFLGSHLCERLIRDGHEVVCLDDFSTGQRKNIADLQIRVVSCDIRIRACLEVLGSFDEIYHLACPASPPDYQADLVRTIETNVSGTLNVLSTAARAKVVFASTSEVYGDPERHPQSEDYWGNVNPVGPRACYVEGKRVAETLCTHYGAKIARIFNTFGPGMQEGRVIPNFIAQAKRSDPLTVYGDGTQTRSFCYVDDLVDGLVKLMASDVQRPVNFGNPHEVQIANLAFLVKEMTGSSSPLEFRPLPQDDPKRRCPDISKAERELGWHPRVSLSEGLQRTINGWASLGQVFFS